LSAPARYALSECSRLTHLPHSCLVFACFFCLLCGVCFFPLHGHSLRRLGPCSTPTGFKLLTTRVHYYRTAARTDVLRSFSAKIAHVYPGLNGVQVVDARHLSRKLCLEESCSALEA